MMSSYHHDDKERLCSSLALEIHSLHFHVRGSNDICVVMICVSFDFFFMVTCEH